MTQGRKKKSLKAILSKASNNTQAENNNGLDNRFVCIFLTKKMGRNVAKISTLKMSNAFIWYRVQATGALTLSIFSWVLLIAIKRVKKLGWVTT